jgi:hypothetical protein
VDESVDDSVSAGPYLIVAAFWQDDDNTEAVAEAVSREKFPQPDGWPRGAVVSFRREVATDRHFLADLARFDLAELAPLPKSKGTR